MKNRKIRTFVKQQNVLKELKNNFGIVRHACQASLVSKTQFYDWFKQDENFRKDVIEVYQNLRNYVLAKKLTQIMLDDKDTLRKMFRQIDVKLVVSK